MITHSNPTWSRLASATLLVTLLAGCGASDSAEETVEDAVDAAEQSASNAEEASADISETLRENGLESIASAVEEIDFAELADSEEFTFFAPNDDAFQSLDTDDMADLLSFDGGLEDTLRNHVVSERIDAAALAEMSSVETTGGMTLPVVVDGNTITVGGVAVVDSDVDIDDGIVHVVDGLILER